MKKRIGVPTVVLAVAITLSKFSTCTAEPLLKVDFGIGGAPSPVQPGFTGVAGGTFDTQYFEQVGPYGVSLDGGGFHATGSANSIAAGVRSLYRDYYYNNSPVNGDGVFLVLSGFNAQTPYNVTLWSYDSDQLFSPTTTTWDPVGDTTGTSGQVVNFAEPYPTTLTEYSTTLQLTSTTGTLEIFGTTTSGNGGTRLNGVRVNDGASDVLSLDFGRTSQPPSPIQATYTSMAGDVAQTNASQQIGDFVVTVEGQGFYNTTSSNADSVDPSVRDFFRDYYYNNAIDPGEGIDLTIDGILANTDYELRLWSYDADNFSATPTIWEPTGDTTGQTGNVTNVQEPFPTSLTEYDAVIRVRSTTTSLTLSGSTLGGTGGTRLNGFELNLAPEGINGDYNDDGIVDAADYAVWRKSEGTATSLPNDPHGGTIGEQQYNTWQENFGLSLGGGGLGAAVPEPSGLASILIGAILMSRRKSVRRVNNS